MARCLKSSCLLWCLLLTCGKSGSSTTSPSSTLPSLSRSQIPLHKRRSAIPLPKQTSIQPTNWHMAVQVKAPSLCKKFGWSLSANFRATIRIPLKSLLSFKTQSTWSAGKHFELHSGKKSNHWSWLKAPSCLHLNIYALGFDKVEHNQNPTEKKNVEKIN